MMHDLKILFGALGASHTWIYTCLAYVACAGIVGVSYIAQSITEESRSQQAHPRSKVTALGIYAMGTATALGVAALVGNARESAVVFWVCVLVLLPSTLAGIVSGRSIIIKRYKSEQSSNSMRQWEEREKERSRANNPPPDEAAWRHAEKLYEQGEKYFYSESYTLAVFQYREALQILVDRREP